MVKDNRLRILQWNCHSILPKKGLLERVSNNYDLILLCESWLRPDSKFTLRNFNLLRTDRSNRQGGGLLMAMINDIPFIPIHPIYCLNDLLDTQAITIPTDLGQMLIVNVYRTPGSPTHSVDWSAFLNCTSEYDCTLICGDFNSHHHSWGCEITCPSGNLLYQSILDSDLSVINNGNPTRFTHPNRRKSAIDLTLVSPNLRLITEWSTLPDKHNHWNPLYLLQFFFP